MSQVHLVLYFIQFPALPRFNSLRLSSLSFCSRASLAIISQLFCNRVIGYILRLDRVHVADVPYCFLDLSIFSCCFGKKFNLHFVTTKTSTSRKQFACSPVICLSRLSLNFYRVIINWHISNGNFCIGTVNHSYNLFYELFEIRLSHL